MGPATSTHLLCWLMLTARHRSPLDTTKTSVCSCEDDAPSDPKVPLNEEKAFHAMFCFLLQPLSVLCQSLNSFPYCYCCTLPFQRQSIGFPVASSTPLLPDYYKCLYQDSRITGLGTSCFSCLTMGGPADVSRKCFSCIATVGGVNPGQASWCNNCWNGRAKDPIKCQTCLLSAKNSDGAYCSDNQPRAETGGSFCC